MASNLSFLSNLLKKNLFFNLKYSATNRKAIKLTQNYSTYPQIIEPQPTKTGKHYLNQNLTFYSSDCVDKEDKRSLLVLFAWLFAKERHLDKYRTLYIQKGFDVLTVKIQVLDFLIPSRGSHVVAQNIVDFLKDHNAEYPTFIFHAFSVGAYQMGEVFVHLKKDENHSVLGKTQQSLKGIVYDSAIDVNEAPIGLSKATTNNSILQKCISTAMRTHLKIFYNCATKHYISSSNAIHINFFKCPTLVLLSRNDEVANHVNTFKAIENWKGSGIKVFHKCWENSPHVSHYFKYPQEYQTLIETFLKNINAI